MTADMIADLRWLALTTLKTLSDAAKAKIAAGKAADAGHYAKLAADTAGHLMALDAPGA